MIILIGRFISSKFSLRPQNWQNVYGEISLQVSFFCTVFQKKTVQKNLPVKEYFNLPIA